MHTMTDVIWVCCVCTVMLLPEVNAIGGRLPDMRFTWFLLLI